MVKRVASLFLTLSLFFCVVESVKAQGTHKFLGKPRTVPDKFSPRFGIRYNTQGFENPKAKWNKKVAKWQNKGVPDAVIQEILTFPGSDDSIGIWIDEAYAKVSNQFMQCGGSVAQRANRVSPNGLKITIMPSAFYEPYWKVNVAGVYYPATREIKVLNIYYIWSGPNTGWLRHARDLLEWEIGNFFGIETQIQPEPRAEGWPCNAPPMN